MGVIKPLKLSDYTFKYKVGRLKPWRSHEVAIVTQTHILHSRAVERRGGGGMSISKSFRDLFS